jgi:phospholipase/carboxylesterase
MLEYEIANRSARADADLVVLLHGRGSDMHDLLPLGKRLGDRTVVAPQAPFAGAPWGYGPGWAWYQFMGRNRPDAESFTHSLQAIHEFLQQLPNALGISPRRIVLGGFSQGGTLSTAYALVHQGVVARVLNFSGFLADHPQVVVNAETVASSEFFWAHGTQDGNIPFELAIEGRAKLVAAGAKLETRDYDIGHWIDPRELQDATAWLDRT